MKMLENENLEIDVKPIRQRRTIGAIMEILWTMNTMSMLKVIPIIRKLFLIIVQKNH